MLPSYLALSYWERTVLMFCKLRTFHLQYRTMSLNITTRLSSSNTACVPVILESHCVVWFCLLVFQYSLGGPIIAFQVENEYGFYGEHDRSKEYMAYLKTVRKIKILAINNVTLGKQFA